MSVLLSVQMDRFQWRRKTARWCVCLVLLTVMGCGGGEEPGESHDPDVAVAGAEPTQALNSLALIRTAEEAGALDLDTAWTYRLQAVFEPDKLPEAYRSETSIKDADATMVELLLVKDRLSEETLARLRPYLVRPTHPESIYYEEMMDSGETTVASVGFGFTSVAYAAALVDTRPPDATPVAEARSGPVVFHAPRSHGAVARLARDMHDNNDMYRRFANLMGLVPINDWSDEPNGGDERIDVYMVPSSSWDGLCVPTVVTGQYSSAWILIDRALRGTELASTIAHELFHAFQFAFDVGEDRWWMEATATWSEDFIGSQWNEEHQFVEDAFLKSEKRLLTLDLFNEVHEYGAYIYPYYLSLSNRPELIADTWFACQEKKSLDALDGTVPDGFDESFKDFALATIDYGPYKGFFVDEGTPIKMFDHHDLESIVLEKAGEQEHEVELPALSARYYRIENQLDPEKTPMVRFRLDHFANSEDLGVQAIINPEGDARDEDWSDVSEKEFCINRPAENFKEIALVITSTDRNHNVESSADLFIEVEPGGCSEIMGQAVVNAKFTETTTTEQTVTWPTGRVTHTETNSNAQIEASLMLTLELTDKSFVEATNSIDEHYEITDCSLKSFNLSGHSRYESTHHEADGDRTWSKVSTSDDWPMNPEPECGGVVIVTLDAETLKARYAGPLVMYVNYEYHQRNRSKTSGGDSSSYEIEAPSVPFAIGPPNAKSEDEIASEAGPELQEIEQMAREMEKLAQKAQGMNYEEVGKFFEQFEERHDTDDLTRKMEGKLLAPDLWVTGGDGKKMLKGGGSKDEQKPIKNGTTSTHYEFDWTIYRNPQ